MVCFLPRDALLALLQQSSAAVCLWVQIRWLTWPLKNTNKYLALRNSCVAFAECFGVIICLHCKCCPVSFAASGLAWAECNWYDFWFFPVTSFSRHIISKHQWPDSVDNHAFPCHDFASTTSERQCGMLWIISCSFFFSIIFFFHHFGACFSEPRKERILWWSSQVFFQVFWFCWASECILCFLRMYQIAELVTPKVVVNLGIGLSSAFILMMVSFTWTSLW